ncbi:uncharacterized protein BO97DRAFT_342806 [Aspergillus homomorphus CBS 101889]|uniref:Sulfotransferase domain-containing protein n=1 Tax=Aspergillus homomorphus (strain CBS 101889) TaxID=1450537 RepID=A0A395I0F2_ASPHC|nr:hypothetical protein BO97DRAFT_342806 [Aspergillus homomorphus CBS 101889]RAL13540.1 hypothetical protein BO97DRAFT_342806 [Aspergillus homomorphus CBS 101889]
MRERETICRGQPIEQWSRDETDAIRRAFQQNLDHIEATSQAANAEGKIFFAKEHTLWLADPAAVTQYLSTHEYRPSTRLGVQVPSPYSSNPFSSPKNITIFPDAYLATWRPTFLIRHPALVFPSYYRALLNLEEEGFAEPDMVEPMLELHSTLLWTRLLFDWFCDRQAQSCSGRHREPILLDAQDVIHHPAVVQRYCELVGLSPEKVRFAWQETQARRDGHASAEAVMMVTLDHSTSLLKDKTPAMVDVRAEKRKWEAEFGGELAARMEKWVENAMPDYNYLYSKRLRGD